MQNFLVELPVFIYTVDNHKEIKEELLSLISKNQSSSIINGVDNIQATDWNVPADVERSYFNKMIEVFAPALKEFRKAMNAKEVNLASYWFQQYENNGNHIWHTHTNSMYNMVYYVELPEKAEATNLLTNKGCVVPNAKEGDILLFPSSLFHSSPPNQDNKRKTVIAANIDFE